MGSGGQNKFSREQAIESFIRTHGEGVYGYDDADYINNLTPIKIYCFHHQDYFTQIPKNHKKGGKCPKCIIEEMRDRYSKGKNKFIKEMVEMHGDEYDLSLVEYINNKTPVKIISKEYGLLEIRPDVLLAKLNYVPKGKKKTKSTDKEMFLEEVYKIYGNRNDYVDTIVGDSRGKIDVVCKQHGKFTVSMHIHFKGQGCPKCSAINYSKIRTKSTEEFVKQALAVHGDNCDYTNTKYKSSGDKVEVKCNKHNIFFNILPANHLTGTRCKKCFSENQSELFKGKEGTCGYSKSGYVKQANGREACVYLIKCWNENEEFYKVGKTFLNINKRFTKSNLCYEYEEVSFIYGEAGEVYDLENELHRRYKTYKYRPEKWFAGHTECYKVNLPIEEIKNTKI